MSYKMDTLQSSGGRQLFDYTVMNETNRVNQQWREACKGAEGRISGGGDENVKKERVVQKAGSKNVLGRGKKYMQWLCDRTQTVY